MVSRPEKSSSGSPAGVVSRAFPGESGAANSVSVSPGSRLLAAGYQSGVVKLWDPNTGKTVASLPGQVGSVSAVAFSPDNRLLAATSGDRTVRLWDFAQQKEAARLVGHREPVLAVAFSPDGHTVATASADATVRLWDAATGEGRAVFAGHTDWGTSVVFSDDGHLVFSGGRDRSVRVWDVERSRERMTIEADASVWSVAITAQQKPHCCRDRSRNDCGLGCRDRAARMDHSRSQRHGVGVGFQRQRVRCWLRVVPTVW